MKKKPKSPTAYQRGIVIRLIRQGKTTPQIMAYCKLTRQQVAAYRAHITRGHIS